MFVRNSGAGNGCANFMGAWKNAFFLQEKPMFIKFLLLGGGGLLGFGGECRFYFYGREDFSEQHLCSAGIRGLLSNLCLEVLTLLAIFAVALKQDDSRGHACTANMRFFLC